MGLDLRSPVIIASGPLTSSLDGLKKAEDSGAGAVVLKSIFEEQIEEDASREALGNEQYLSHSDSHEYYAAMARDFYIDRYLTLLESAKKSLSIPVIASINCKSARTWVDYAERFSGCGADAIELNYFPIASNASVSGEKVDKALFEFAKVARSRISGKLSMKIGAQAISSDTEYGMSLRWTALMSAEVGLDIAANTGIHSADTLIKMLLAGAKAVEVCSAVMKDGYGVISKMNEGLSAFMDEKGYSTLDDFIGKLAEENYERGDAWERVQFLKTIGQNNER